MRRVAMVDVDRGERGMPGGHPWKGLSRARMAWHTFLSVALVWMLGSLVFGLATLGGSGLNVLESAVPILYAIVLSALGAGLIFAFGPWLTRYSPFSQSLLFGGTAVAVLAILLTVVSVWESVARGPCPPSTFCTPPLLGVLYGTIIFGFPAFLTFCIGWGLAIWSPTPRGSWVFWPLFALVLVTFVSVQVLLHL